MKKINFADIGGALLLLLFAYAATSKFLDHHRFVFQMGLAPLPVMRVAAPALGWLIPFIELLIVVGLLIARLRIPALYASVILLFIFEIYIVGMLLSGERLPCTCGGIISKMSWTAHLSFNAFFIVIGIVTINRYQKYSSPTSVNTSKGHNKDLFRA